MRKIQKTVNSPFGSVIKIMLLALLMAFNYVLFIIPNSFAPAGINGIATMIQYKLHFSIAYMSLIVNVPLCVFSYLTTDKRFAVRTLIFCLTYSVGYLGLQQLDLSSIQYDAGNIDTIFPCLIAGMVNGFIYGCCFRLGTSTGGTDIISKYISHKQKSVNFFWVTFAINIAVATISFFVYAKEVDGRVIHDYKPVCLCMLYCFITSYVGNRILQGSRFAYHYIIITSHADEIEWEIIHTLRHSATRLNATGSYSHQERQVLLSVVNRHQLNEMREMLEKYDNTFAYVESVNDTVGNFKKIQQKS